MQNIDYGYIRRRYDPLPPPTSDLIVESLAVTNLTEPRIPYIGPGGLFKDSAQLTFDDITNVVKIDTTGDTGGLWVEGHVEINRKSSINTNTVLEIRMADNNNGVNLAGIAFIGVRSDGTLASGAGTTGFTGINSNVRAINAGDTYTYIANFNSGANSMLGTLGTYVHYDIHGGALITIPATVLHAGFKGNIQTATNSWNFYAAGTAHNYFNGNVLIGSTTDRGKAFEVFRADNTVALFQSDSVGATKIGVLLGPKSPTVQITGSDTNENFPGSLQLVTPNISFGGTQRGSEIYFIGTRSTTAQIVAGTFVTLTANDQIGSIRFGGDNGVDRRNQGIVIAGVVPVGQTWSGTSTPGHLYFYTTPSGGTTPLARWSIDMSGHLLAGSNNLYDIGSNTPLMPRNIYFGTQILGSSGTSANPTYSFSSNTGLGLYLRSGHLVYSAGNADNLAFNNNKFTVDVNGGFSWSSTTDPLGTEDLLLLRDAANVLAQRNGVNAQTSRIYGTFTDASNYERLEITVGTTVNIRSQAAGTGTARTFQIGTGGAADFNLMTNNTARWRLAGASGDLITLSDNTYSIGSFGAFRPRYAFFSGGLSIGPAPSTAADGVIFLDRTANAALVLQTAGVSQGQLRVTGTNTISITDGGGSNTRFEVNTGAGISLYPANNTVEIRNSTNPQLLRMYNTFTDTSNYERLTFGFSGNVLVLFSEALGTGTQRSIRIGGSAGININFQTNGLDRFLVNNSGHFVAGADNSYDIGASGANRPRSFYFGTQILAPDGSNTVPSYSFSGASNLGWYRDNAGGGLIGTASGTAVFRIANAADFIVIANNAALGFSRTGILNSDTFLRSEASGILAQRNSTSAQVSRIYKTFTDASNYERVDLGADATGFFVIGAHAGTGLSRPLRFGVSNSVQWKIDTTGAFVAETDNSWDIGASAGNRARDVYVARNITYGGVLLTTPTTAAGSIRISRVTTLNNIVVSKNPAIQISNGDGNSPANISLLHVDMASTTDPVQFAAKYEMSGSRATHAQLNAGTYSAVLNNDVIGYILWNGDDGTNMRTAGARIWTQVNTANETVTTGRVPMNLNIEVIDNASIVFIADGGSARMQITGVGNIVLGTLGALATNATNGFIYIPTSAGTPVGVPTSFSGKVAMEYDTTNDILYAYDGAWIPLNYTNEQAQDAVGTILTNGGGITWTYNDAAPSISGVVSITSTSVTDFAEAVDDRVAALLVAGTNVTLTYNDGANTLTIDVTGAGGYTNEEAQDAVGGILTDSSTIDFTYDDGANTITAIVKDASITYAKIQNVTDACLLGRSSGSAGPPIEITVGTGLSLSAGSLTSTITQYTDELAQDAVGNILTNGGGLTWTYNDGANTISAVVSITSSSVTDFSEAVDDRVGALLVAGSNITLNYNDGANTLTISFSDPFVDELHGPDGAVGNPTYSFASETNMGWYRGSSQRLHAAIAGSDVIIVAPTGTRFMGTPNNAVVILGTDATANTFLYNGPTSNILEQRNGVNSNALRVYNTYTDASNYERIEIQSGTTMSIISRSLGTGTARALTIGTVGSVALNFQTNNTVQWFISSASGHFLANVDNTNDIGASGAANRPRTAYIGTSVIIAANATYTVNSIFTVDNTNNFQLAGGNTGASGNILLYGGAEATTPNEIRFRQGTTVRWKIASSGGHFLAETDNSIDIGAAGATRPRTGYFGTSLISPRFDTTAGVNHVFGSGTRDALRIIHNAVVGDGIEIASVDTTGSGSFEPLTIRGDGVAIGNITPSSTTNLILPASTTGISSLRIPHGTAPSAPVNGDIWTTTASMFVRINGVTVDLAVVYTDEQVDDRVAALIQNGTGITWSYNDGANTLTPTVTITQYTDELAQDSVGNILVDSSTIDFTYDDATPSITAIVKDNSITYAKMQDVSAASKLLGRGDSGAGDTQEITLGTGLTMTGTTLSSTGGSGSTMKIVYSNETLTTDTNEVQIGVGYIEANGTGNIEVNGSGLLAVI